MPVKDKNGNLLTTEKEQEARWAEHFQEMLNRQPPDQIIDIPETENDLEVNTEIPTTDEIVTAIKSLKNGKSPGLDNLNAELFKADPGIAASVFLPLIQSIWSSNRIPDDWCKGSIIKIPKKGALNNCNNWRGITLLSIPSKILAKIVINRISTTKG